MPAPLKNRNAQKSADRVADAFLHMRVRAAEKSIWESAAHPETLSSWIRRKLNRAAKRAEANKPVEATETRGAVRSMKTGDRTG
jgi:hypothetical protein